MADRVVFFTGFPGFIGRRLVARLLEEGRKVRIAALVEPRFAEQARAAAAELDPDRIEILPGDIGDRRLGLRRGHLRAADRGGHQRAPPGGHLRPGGAARAGAARERGGHRQRARPLRALHPLRTAQLRVHRVRGGRPHRRRLRARAVARARASRTTTSRPSSRPSSGCASRCDACPTTIYRPAIVVGDSQTGETQKFDGPYYMLRTIAPRRSAARPIPKFGRADGAVQRRPGRLHRRRARRRGRRSSAVGETLHLVRSEPVSARATFPSCSPRVRRPGAALPRAAEARRRPRCARSACATPSAAPRTSRSAT